MGMGMIYNKVEKGLIVKCEKGNSHRLKIITKRETGRGLKDPRFIITVISELTHHVLHDQVVF